MAGKKLFHGGRALTVTEAYEGHGSDDPSGYYYAYDDAPRERRWISTGGLSVRFTTQPAKD